MEKQSRPFFKLPEALYAYITMTHSRLKLHPVQFASEKKNAANFIFPDFILLQAPFYEVI